MKPKTAIPDLQALFSTEKAKLNSYESNTRLYPNNMYFSGAISRNTVVETV